MYKSTSDGFIISGHPCSPCLRCNIKYEKNIGWFHHVPYTEAIINHWSRWLLYWLAVTANIPRFILNRNNDKIARIRYKGMTTITYHMKWVRPWTVTVTWCETSPSMFLAVHWYVPSSAAVTLGMMSSLSRTWAWSGSCPPTLSQFNVGYGLPTAMKHISYHQLSFISYCSSQCTQTLYWERRQKMVYF